MKTKLRNQKGFTIIEVLIVLAIAGLIMLIVFLAVPALQRNQRNTARKNDVGRTATAVSNWVSNNNGSVFTAGTSNANLTAVINDVGPLGQYKLTAGSAASPGNPAVAANITVATGTQTTKVSNLDNMVIVTGAVCDTANTGQTTSTNASTRSLAIQYATEGAGGPVGQCLNV